MSGFGSGGYGGRGRRDQTVRRLNRPRNARQDTRIEGLAVGYFEYAGKLFRVTVSGAREAKSERHVGWISVSERQRR